ncbi:hypothetical protein BV25DRAFT_1910601 [Artomyces pyxidatus]|uniref:Uncharacterized protein n=1 Tax=Artomyces pyxidatus TaxID=48021 RepID=A0ACB8TKC8_9AGAM|nr:hypothetical protein BV25DRAFT_1910601 [Artomyces pyxidatus]
MDRFLAPHSPEAVAHFHVTENSYSWDMEQASLNEAVIAGCAAYQALSRYLSGADLVFVPSTRRELESTLRRYAYDAIHNIIATARTSLQPGGYSRTCHLSEDSIGNMLNNSDHLDALLALHTRSGTEHVVPDMEHSPSRPIKIN